MLLTIDIGNTLTCLGVYQGSALLATLKIESDLYRPQAAFQHRFVKWLEERHFNSESLTGCIISSVVPPLGAVWGKIVFETLDIYPKFVSPEYRGNLKLDIDNPKEVGSDIIADAVGALAKYGPMTVVADLGTASKLILIDNEGAFAGLSIAPGVQMSGKALKEKTAALPEIPLKTPSKAVGKNTEECLLSGIVYGSCFLIRGLAEQFEKEVGYPLTRVLTGGNAAYCAPLLPSFTHDEYLILDGLRVIYEGGFEDER